MITNPTIAAFEELLTQEQPVVVDFNATWCGPCRMIAPILEELDEEYAGRVTFVAVDVDACEELAFKFNIRNIPAVFFIKGGETVDKNVGAAPKNVFVEKIEKLLQ